jgi:hypothetical protein
VEQHLVVACHPDGRKVLHVRKLAELIRLVFYIHPAEFHIRKLLAQGEKARPLLDARIAPLGAKAAADDGHG